VKQGQVLGYQGEWSGGQSRTPLWAQLRFGVVRPAPGGRFPDSFEANFVDLTPYLGVTLRDAGSYRDVQQLQCAP